MTSARTQSFEVETGLGSLLKVSTFLSCFPDLYRMEYRYAERITAHRTILEIIPGKVRLINYRLEHFILYGLTNRTV